MRVIRLITADCPCKQWQHLGSTSMCFPLCLAALVQTGSILCVTAVCGQRDEIIKIMLNINYSAIEEGGSALSGSTKLGV